MGIITYTFTKKPYVRDIFVSQGYPLIFDLSFQDICIFKWRSLNFWLLGVCKYSWKHGSVSPFKSSVSSRAHRIPPLTFLLTLLNIFVLWYIRIFRICKKINGTSHGCTQNREARTLSWNSIPAWQCFCSHHRTKVFIASFSSFFFLPTFCHPIFVTYSS